MVFDGDIIQNGDLVHDLVFGSGNVDAINEGEGTIRVKFGNQYRTYIDKGHGHFPQKTLYWRDPIGNFTPPKGGTRWALFEEMRKAVSVVCNTTRNVKED